MVLCYTAFLGNQNPAPPLNSLTVSYISFCKGLICSWNRWRQSWALFNKVIMQSTEMPDTFIFPHELKASHVKQLQRTSCFHWGNTAPFQRGLEGMACICNSWDKSNLFNNLPNRPRGRDVRQVFFQQEHLAGSRFQMWFWIRIWPRRDVWREGRRMLWQLQTALTSQPTENHKGYSKCCLARHF